MATKCQPCLLRNAAGSLVQPVGTAQTMAQEQQETPNVSVMWQRRDISQQQCSTVLCTLVSFVLLVIHLGSPPLPLLFLKATVAFTGSADRMS